MPPAKPPTRADRKAAGFVSVEVYLSPEEREVIRQAAEAERTSMSQLLAKAGIATAKKILKKIAD